MSENVKDISTIPIAASYDVDTDYLIASVLVNNIPSLRRVVPSNVSFEETAESIKTKYESNANTNAFTDAEKTKLAGLSSGLVSITSDDLPNDVILSRHLSDEALSALTSSAITPTNLVSDGTTDNAAALQVHINSAIADGKILYIPAGDYYCSTTLLISSNLHLVMHPDANLIFPNLFTSATDTSVSVGLLGKGSRGAEVLLSSNASAGATTISVSSAASFSVGGMILIGSEEQFRDNVPRAGELNFITAIAGTTLTLQRKLRADYTTANGAFAQHINPIENVTIEGGKITSTLSTSPTKQHVGIRFDGAYRVNVKNVFVSTFDYSGVTLAATYGGVVDGLYAEDIGWVNGAQSGTAHATDAHEGSEQCTFTNIIARRAGKLFDIGGFSSRHGVCRNISVTNSYGFALTRQGVGLHAPAHDITFENLYTEAVDGPHVRAANVTFNNCHFIINSGGEGFRWQPQGYAGFIKFNNGTIYSPTNPAFEVVGINSGDQETVGITGIQVHGSTITGVADHALSIEASSNNPVNYLSIIGNTLITEADNSALDLYANTVNFNYPKILGNTIIALSVTTKGALHFKADSGKRFEQTMIDNNIIKGGAYAVSQEGSGTLDAYWGIGNVINADTDKYLNLVREPRGSVVTATDLIAGSYKQGDYYFSSDHGSIVTATGSMWTLAGLRAIGTTAQRPVTPYVGFKYYDTTLASMIRWDGSGWVDVDTGGSVELPYDYNYESIPGLPTPSLAQVASGALPSGWSATDSAGVYDTATGSTRRPNHSANGGSYSRNRTYHIQLSNGKVYLTGTTTLVGTIPSSATAQWDIDDDDVIWYQPNSSDELHKITIVSNTFDSDVSVTDLTEFNSAYGESQTTIWFGGPSEGFLVGGTQADSGKKFTVAHTYDGGTYCLLAAYNITDGVWCPSTQVLTVQTSGQEFDFGGVGELGDYFGIKPRPQSTSFVVPYYFYKITTSGLAPAVPSVDTGVGHSWLSIADIDGVPTSVWMSPEGTTMRVYRMDNGQRACANYTIEGDWSSKGHGGPIKYSDWSYCTDTNGSCTAFKWNGTKGSALGTSFIRTDTTDANLSISGIDPDSPTDNVWVDFSHSTNVIKERTFSN